ncbi:hypothetical protein OG413_39235 [Streptomyces sp. NBC_01433]|uniref:hypothetical protein n=1 Tax=Streptomyces sp. NBC_01433 TaxID=2903864 RepID=UPI002250535A|nr:hypothetical protein [Streptomyces sp. NBC_01433]MCX4681240.1 hypothetical protein [Streptomyces sp. NBC_01433]
MLVAIVGVVGGVLAAVIGSWAALRARHPPEARLELVDVSIVSNQRTGSRYADWRDGDCEEHIYAVVLDVKVRNNGGRVVVLKRFHVVVEQAHASGSGPRLRLESALEASGTYAIMLPEPRRCPAREEPSTAPRIGKDISHVVPPGDADRIKIRLMMSIPKRQRYRYQVRLVLDYNVNGCVASDPLAFACPAV